MTYSEFLQGRCNFKDKQGPAQVTLRKDIVKRQTIQVVEYRSELLRVFWFNPILQQEQEYNRVFRQKEVLLEGMN